LGCIRQVVNGRLPSVVHCRPCHHQGNVSILLLPSPLCLQFKPERWLDNPQYATDPATGVPRFVPFGIGPKACVAQQLAYVQLKVCTTVVCVYVYANSWFAEHSTKPKVL
jgi:hypothetical protein